MDHTLSPALMAFITRGCPSCSKLEERAYASNYGTEIFKLTVQGTLLFFVQSKLLWTVPICTLLVFTIQKIYLRTSRQLRLLELESRSSLYSGFLELVSSNTP